MAQVVMYVTGICPYCHMAESLLRRKGVSVHKVRVDLDPSERMVMLDRSNGRRTVPQIFIGDFHVGGFDDLAALDRAGQLDPLLTQP
ncbi:glutaredoxin 3 [Thermithiobacillus plumbiphilus]|uniref:Glutaredoxin n=1 Tax=Thermithiobacillus plumbiphilus TaxID=1729899 RepID=A0ABU9D9M0_9PROT